MRSIDHAEIHSEVFSARIDAIDALRAAALGHDESYVRLYDVAEKLRAVSQLYGIAPNAKIYSAFAELVHSVGMAAEWADSVLKAKPDTSRFVIAVRERSKAWSASNKGDALLTRLDSIATKLEELQEISDAAKIAADLATVPLPIGLYTEPDRSSQWSSHETEKDGKPAKLTVAFVKFTVDGKPLEEIHHLSPGETHDLDIEVRVSRWPAGATGLVIEPVSIERGDTYQMPVFSITAPVGNGPFQLRQHGRAILNFPHHMHARPYEFKYVAKFVPQTVEQPVDVVGQRTLLFEGIDLVRSPITGYANLDRKLMEIRNQLRQTPGIPQDELLNALGLVAPLANYAGQVVQDNLYDSAVSEAEFQKRLKSFLRGQPKIGSDLEEHPRAGGGITDLSFKGIRLELKAESSKAMCLEDCQSFVGQTASYAVASGKRLAVLCVLDCSAKTQAPFPMEDGFGILIEQTGASPVRVITILLQGNLATPSSLSR